MSNNLTLSVTLVGDGKSLDGTITVSREHLRKLAIEAKATGDALAGGSTSAAQGLRSISTQLDEAQKYTAQLRDSLLGIGKGGLVFAGLAFGVDAVARSLLGAGLAAEKIGNQLRFVSGSSTGAVVELEYLRKVTNQVGVDFTASAAAYGKLAAASKGTSLEGQRTRDVFESISKASAVMGLSTEESSGALLAIGQMMSKGTVQAEELRGQLGERIPGAFNIAARAMGVTTGELSKMLEQGEVVSSSFLPRFAEALNRSLGESPQSVAASAQAQLNRLNSSWDQFKQALAGSGFLTIAANGMGILAAGINSVNLATSAQIARNMKDLERLEQLRAGEAASGEDTSRTEKLITDTRRRIGALQDEAKAVNAARGQRANGSDADAQREANRARAVLDMSAVDTEAVNKYVENTLRLSEAEKKRQSIDKATKARDRLLGENPGASQRQKADIEAAYQQELKLIEERANKKSKAVADLKNDMAQSYGAAIAAEKDFAKTEVTLIEARIQQRQITESEGVDAVLAVQERGYLEQVRLLVAQISKTKDLGDIDRLRKQITSAGLEMSEVVAKAASARLKLADAELKHQQEWLKGIGDETASLLAKATAAEEENARIGMTSDQLAELTAKRYEEAIEIKEAQAFLAFGVVGRENEVFLIEQQIEALKRLKSAEIAKPKLTEQARAWGKFTDDIERSLTDSLYRSFESGKGFGETFVESLRNTLKAAALKMVIQYVVSGSGQIVGTLGNAALNSVLGTGGKNGGVNYLGTASNASTLYGALSGGYLGYIQAAQAGYGLTAAEAAKAAASYYQAGYYGTGAAIQAGNAAAGTGAAASSTSAAAGGAGALGTLGWAAAGALAGYWLGSRMFGTGKVEAGASGLQGAFGFNGDYQGLARYQEMRQQGGWFRSGRSWTNTYGVDPETAAAYSTSVRRLADPYKALDLAAGGNTSTVNSRGAGWQYQFQREINGEADLQALFSDMAESIGERVAPELAKFRLEGEKLYQTAGRMQETVAVTNMLAGVLGKDLSSAFGSLGITSLGVRQAVVDATGGLDAFKAEVGFFSDNFRSEVEKTFDNTTRLRAAFAGLGVAMPTTSEGFRKLVQSVDLTSEAGRTAFAGLMDMAGGFKAWADAAQASAAAVSSLRASMADESDRFGLQLRTVSAAFVEMGLAVPTSKAGFMALLDALDVTTLAGLRTRQALLDVSGSFTQMIERLNGQMQALKDERLAIAKNVIGERDSLINAILTTMGKTTTLRQIDLAKIDPLNREMALFSYALSDAAQAAKDMATAQSNFTQASEAAMARTLNAGASISSLVNQLRAGSAQATVSGTGKAYRADLSAAQGGDIAAAERLSASASAYAETLRNTARNQTELDIALSRMANSLSALPATQSYAARQLAELELIKTNLNTARDAMTAATQALQASLVNVLSTGFGSLDGNLNGLLTFDELKAGLGGMATDDQIKRLIAAVDVNGDGQISKMEAVKAATQAVDENTLNLVDGSDVQILAMRAMVAETITNSGRLMGLNASILEMTNAITVQNEMQRKATEINNKNLALEALIKQQQGTTASVNAGIAGIWNLANQFGVTLQANPGDGDANSAIFQVANGLFSAQYNQLSSNRSNPDFDGFKNTFYAPGGVYDQTYGRAAELASIAAQINNARAAIIALGGVPKFATGGLHAGGLRIVGEHGPELEATGPARIFNAADTRAMLAGGNGLDAVITELRALREENVLLRSAVGSVATHTYKTAKRLEEVVGDGLLVRTETGYPLATVAA